MEFIMNFLLLTVLFVAGFVNFLFYFPTKRFTAWFQSIKPSPSPQISHFKSAAIAAVAVTPPVTMEKKSELKKMFGTFDKNDDGFITKKELVESLRNMRMMITERETEEMFEGVDENGDGLIDFEEFCVLGENLVMGFEQKRKGIQNHEDQDDDDDDDDDGDEELREAFGVFDKDKDGLISVEELSLILSCLGLNQGKIVDNCKEMIRKVDLDGDGMVNFHEFKKMMRNGPNLI